MESEWNNNTELVEYNNLPDELKLIIQKNDLVVEKDLVSYLRNQLITRLYQASKEISKKVITEEDVVRYIEREREKKKKL
jgi:hypothetical protein